MLPVAVRTGLEPATPGVTGRYSNQLNYRTICSDLCVFLERGCKGTHFFETCKFFLSKKYKKVQKNDGGTHLWKPPSDAHKTKTNENQSVEQLFALFHFDHPFFILHLLGLELWNPHMKHSVFYACLDSIPV